MISCFIILLASRECLLDNSLYMQTVSMEEATGAPVTPVTLSKDWTQVFSIEDYVVEYFIDSGREWIFGLMERNFKNPKKAHSGFVIQFGEAMSLLGRENCEAAGKVLYHFVKKSKFYKKAQCYRRIARMTGIPRMFRYAGPLTYRMVIPDSYRVAASSVCGPPTSTRRPELNGRGMTSALWQFLLKPFT